MKIYKLPAEYSNPAILFDMDNTLYTHDEYAKTQIDLPVKRLAQLKGKTFEQMNDEVSQYRKKWAEDHGGQTVSLSNALLAFGVSMEENIRWRDELFRPEDYLAPDNQLRCVLKVLESRFCLAVVTNNTVSVAVRTLSVLGVHGLLEKIVGLDTVKLSKPDKIHFLKAAELCGTPVQQCISVGDRYDIDIALPLEMGMGGILVDNVEDVYKLPDLFASGNVI
ncbi:MAG: HAD family hydrolase [Treponema sp.]|jgi:phosphoglycolate phosphatase/putative hydrolase of the HAD superfamily|nr:HAD family hydrolase [Treponema sp.]